MAANMLPILAIAGAFFLLSKKKGGGSGNGANGSGDGGNGANGSGDGSNGDGGLSDGAPSTGAIGPDWDKPTPEATGLISTSYDIQLRMGTGGMINEVLLQGPDGSDPDTDLRLKEGVGHERLVIGFNKPGVWEITLTGIAGDTQQPFTRSWTFEAAEIMESQIHKKCPPGQVYSCETLGGIEFCGCQTKLADINTIEKGSGLD